MTTVEVLKAARARIERGWCQGRLAVDADGCDVAPYDEEAVAWCLFGATAAESSVRLQWEADHMVHRVLGRGVVLWNDAPGRTKEEVLAVFDKAISLAESEVAP